MTPPTRKQGDEFLRIPKAVREMRGMNWNAKALACHLRFRQRNRETVSIGQRQLGRDLGMDKDTIGRAMDEAQMKGLIKILNRKTRSHGQRYVYDARPIDSLSSVPNHKTLAGRASQGKCPQSPNTTVPQVGTAGRPRGGDTTVPQAGTRQEEVKKNYARREKEPEERLLSLAFPSGHSGKQKTALTNAVRNAHRAGIPYAWMAQALVSNKVDGAPWERIDGAIEKAKAIVAEINRHSRKRFQDLQQVVEHAANDRDDLPGQVRVEAHVYAIAKIVTHATEWPDQTGADG